MPRKPKNGNKFPLNLHPTGQWRKQIRGKDYYFGTDRDAALAEYLEVKDDLEAGKGSEPVVEGGTTGVAALVNAFLESKRGRIATGELTAGTWSQYRGVCRRVVEVFGREKDVAELRPDDFARLRAEAAKRLGPRTLGQFTVIVRSIFGWGYETERLEVPVRFGPDFAPPPRRVVRLARAAKGPNLIGSADLARMIAAADPAMRAMLYLGINAAYGPSDCSRLNRADLEREPGWLAGNRVKTGTARRCPLWPETMEALKAAGEGRPKAKSKEDEDAVFLTTMGNRFVVHTDRGDRAISRKDTIAPAFARLAKACGVNLVGRFYTLRHTFRTVADATLDTPAVRMVMGHSDGDIDDAYRERIDDARLIRVTEAVRAWLLAG